MFNPNKKEAKKYRDLIEFINNARYIFRYSIFKNTYQINIFTSKKEK